MSRARVCVRSQADSWNSTGFLKCNFGQSVFEVPRPRSGVKGTPLDTEHRLFDEHIVWRLLFKLRFYFSFPLFLLSPFFFFFFWTFIESSRIEIGIEEDADVCTWKRRDQRDWKQR